MIKCTTPAGLPGLKRFSWFGPNDQILRSSYPDLIAKGDTLMILAVSLKDAGRYTCRVKSSLGKFSAVATIAVSSPPPCEVALPHIVKKPENVTVYLNASGLIEAALCTNYSLLLKPSNLQKVAKHAATHYRLRPHLAEHLNAIQVLDTLNIINATALFDSKILRSLSELQQVVNNSDLLTLDFNINVDLLVNASDLPLQSAINRSAAVANAVKVLNGSHNLGVFLPAPATCPQYQEVFNNTIYLPCETKPDPETVVNVTFYHNGLPVDKSDRRFQFHRGGLLVRNVSPTLAGNYTCVAVKRCASSSVSSFVNVTGKLDIDLLII